YCASDEAYPEGCRWMSPACSRLRSFFLRMGSEILRSAFFRSETPIDFTRYIAARISRDHFPNTVSAISTFRRTVPSTSASIGGRRFLRAVYKAAARAGWKPWSVMRMTRHGPRRGQRRTPWPREETLLNDPRLSPTDVRTGDGGLPVQRAAPHGRPPEGDAA